MNEIQRKPFSEKGLIKASKQPVLLADRLYTAAAACCSGRISGLGTPYIRETAIETRTV